MVQQDEQYHTVAEDSDNPLCLVKIYHYYICHLPSDWPGTILRKGIPYKDRAYVTPDPSTGFRRFARLDKDGALGVNDCNRLVKAVAERCGMTNPALHMASGRRRAGITKIANAGLPSSEVTLAARHQSWQTNALYQIESEEIHERRHEAQQYKVSLNH